LRRIGQVFLARWDVRSLPLADDSVDRVLCNPPFGKQLSSPEEIEPLYRDLVSECSRVMKPGSRAVLLVGDYPAVKSATEAVGWKQLRRFRIRLLGQPAFLTSWGKR
jgi:tRNA G10  N-methylase Trm11